VEWLTPSRWPTTWPERDKHGLLKELHRVRPISLVGEGVYQYAHANGFSVAPRDQLQHYQTTELTRASWRRYKDIVQRDAAAQVTPQQSHSNATSHGERDQQEENKEATQTASKKPRLDHAIDSPKSPSSALEPQGDSPSSTPDTVGCVACDHLGRVCAASSSGGIWLKQSGRLGSSSTIGAGCFAENGEEVEGRGGEEDTVRVSVAASVSGCGESIIEQLVALRCCEMMSGTTEHNDATHNPLQPQQQREAGRGGEQRGQHTMHSVMRSLMVNKQVLSKEEARWRKRRRNRSGSQDTIVEDDGLSTGIIALKVVGTTRGRSGAASEAGNEGGADGLALLPELDVHFTWGHTAHHFAVGYMGVTNSSGRHYDGKAWVNVLQPEVREERGMKMGQVEWKLHLAPVKRNTSSEEDTARSPPHQSTWIGT